MVVGKILAAPDLLGAPLFRRFGPKIIRLGKTQREKDIGADIGAAGVVVKIAQTGLRTIQTDGEPSFFGVGRRTFQRLPDDSRQGTAHAGRA